MCRTTLAQIELDCIGSPRLAGRTDHDEIDRKPPEHTFTREPFPQTHGLLRDLHRVGLVGRETATQIALPRGTTQELVVCRQDLHRAEWRDIPVVVVTAKDLTEEDHRRLNGEVERVLQKDAPTRDEMLREVSATLARCIERGRTRKAAGERT